MVVHFVLIGEGSSDDGLIPHLQALCVASGAEEITGVRFEHERLRVSVGHDIAHRVSEVSALEPNANLIFVHRDADSADPARRKQEIARAFEHTSLKGQWVAVVPVQETEAWLLLSEPRIREIAGRPNGKTPLNLPRPHQVEQVARPKERLQAALLAASETSGRRRDQFRRDFSSQRRRLLLDLPIGNELEQVPAWRQLRADIQAAVSGIARGAATDAANGP